MEALGLSIRQRRFARAFDLGGPALPPGVALMRASAATRVDAFGTVIAVATDTPRFEDGALLIEPAATNLCQDSSALDGPFWALSGGERTSGVAGPDGGAAAVRLTLTAGGSLSRFVTGLTPGSSHVASVWARSADTGGAAHFRITTNNSAAWSSGISARFDLTGAWRRYELAGALSDGANCNLILGAATADAGLDESCLGAIELWGAQVEAGLAATSYAPSEGAPATRAAEALSLDWGMTGLADGAYGLRLFLQGGGMAETNMTVSGGSASLSATAPMRLARAEAL